MTITRLALSIIGIMAIALAIMLSFQIFSNALTTVPVKIVRTGGPLGMNPEFNVTVVNITKQQISGNLTFLQEWIDKADETVYTGYNVGYAKDIPVEQARLLMSVIPFSNTTQFTGKPNSYTAMIEFEGNYYSIRLTSNKL